MAPSSRSHSTGQIVEYIPDRLYLGSFVVPPTADTPLPGTESSSSSSKKRSSRYVDGVAQPPPLVTNRNPPCYFTVDDTLLYNAFHHDFGPLHIGHLYRFAIKFHDILGAKENRDRPIVFWSAADPRSRANAACMLACYMVLIQNWPPHLALAPIAQVDPPLMPFRDAGYSQADYGISVQDVVYGVWKAKEEKCCDLDNFDLDQYEMYERVEHGDFNWITPSFLAFASPQHAPVARITEDSDLHALLPHDVAAVEAHPFLPQPFKNVLSHFSERNVGLVVRLNSHLYSPSYFEALGIQHMDMIFDDGTCPPLPTVRKFIKMAHETISVKKRGVAVHCKAGLGRTGCLIGAYLIYRHGFTANEVIAFMRFMRPGMVVGPQQHWLHLNQGVFREWWVEERVERRIRREMAAAAAAAANAHSLGPSTPIRSMHSKSSMRNGPITTPIRSSPSRTPLSEVDHERNNVGVQEDYLPAPTPGQPRKGLRDRHSHHGNTANNTTTTTMTTTTNNNDINSNANGAYRDKEAFQTTLSSFDETHPSIEQENDSALAASAAPPPHQTMVSSLAVHDPESEDDSYLRVRGQRKPSQSPVRETRDRTRATSQNTAAAVAAAAAVYVIDNDASFDAENIGASKGKAGERTAGPAGAPLAKVRRTTRASKDSAGVRKTSGRVGSASYTASGGRKVSGTT
ncbi:Tyrosine-protein phosphatase cdcA [Escovopsis weberi]|uniref:protein-tyrosine-phosphatase n=1 Tax=Escovopsis weberi TaxID=150374 RepID=A0A0M8MU76_ESCWE|nr:Tyrosine-protein phosphatase cdcA [Escovopsis weberi]